jgi:hypothetical protein
MAREHFVKHLNSNDSILVYFQCRVHPPDLERCCLVFFMYRILAIDVCTVAYRFSKETFTSMLNMETIDRVF